MKYLKRYNESSDYNIPKILSYYDNRDDEKEEALDQFFEEFYNNLDSLLGKFSIKKNKIPSGQYNYTVEVDKIKRKLNKVLDEALEKGLNVDLEDIQSDVVDIDILTKMDNEINSIAEGDEVIAIIKKPFYTQNREMPGKSMIIEFEVQGPKGNKHMNWLGLAATKSSIGMLKLDWCDLVVKKGYVYSYDFDVYKKITDITRVHLHSQSSGLDNYIVYYSHPGRKVGDYMYIPDMFNKMRDLKIRKLL